MFPSRVAVRASVGITLVACATESPIASDPIPEPLVGVSAGVLHTCGTAGSGAVFCWGWNRYGQVGDGTRSDRVFPVLVHAPVPLAATVVGGAHNCGLAAGGEPYCWGLNLSGQVGDGSGTDKLEPVAVAGGLAVTVLDAGGAYTCATKADSTAVCWGWNQFGQVGDGTRTDRALPTPVTGGLKVRTVAAGTQHSCALATDSTAYCWGENGLGQLGNGSTTDTTRPVAVAGGLKFTEIASGVYHTCALTAAGAAYCWGDNAAGQLGDTAAGSSATAPRAVLGGLTFTSLTAGGTHTCAVGAAGAGYCWGSDASGQLGGLASDVCVLADLSQPCARTPVEVLGALSFVMVSAGLHHTCGTTTAGVAYCWGLNDHGQLGDGTRQLRSAPVRVANQEGVP